MRGFLDHDTLDYLSGFRFRGDVDGYPEGELYFAGSPVLSVHGSFAECALLETLALSILNHDTAIASAAARMVSAAEGRPLMEMGSRRTHEQAAVAAARAAYIAGFAGSSNLQAQRRYGIPALGTAGHAYTLLHTGLDGPGEKEAFMSQVDALGVQTTLLVDTYDVATGVVNAIAAAGTGLGPVRIDSGDLKVLARVSAPDRDGRSRRARALKTGQHLAGPPRPLSGVQRCGYAGVRSIWSRCSIRVITLSSSPSSKIFFQSSRTMLSRP